MSAAPEDQIQEVVLKIFRLDDALKAAANQIARPAGQTGARWQVLNALDDGPKTVAEIARLKAASRQGVQRIANELLAEGVLAARSNPKHSRYPLVELTAAGRAALGLIRGQRSRWANSVAAHLGGPIDPAALQFLERFQAAVDKTLSDGSPSWT
jgi:DNA-binding MarR family transcriptional regulator